MSVIKSKRNESSVQFLDTARNLCKFTRQQCVKLPKRYTFFGIQEMYACALRIRDNVKRGNSTFPSNEHEVQIRRDYFMYALSELNVLLEYIGDIRDDFPISDNIMLQWIQMVSDEKRLIKGILLRDKERYKKAGFILDSDDKYDNLPE